MLGNAELALAERGQTPLNRCGFRASDFFRISDFEHHLLIGHWPLVIAPPLPCPALSNFPAPHRSENEEKADLSGASIISCPPFSPVARPAISAGRPESPCRPT